MLPLSFIPYTINTGQLVDSVVMNVTPHTEPNASVPEFTISCFTHGGPATNVTWKVNGVPVQKDRYHETSQLILDTSLNSVYDNRLRVKGRRNGRYECLIWNNIRHYLPDEADLIVRNSTTINGKQLSFTFTLCPSFKHSCRRAHYNGYST